MLLTYFLNDFEIVPVAPIITGIALVVFSKTLSAIHIAPYHFSYFLFCPSLSVLPLYFPLYFGLGGFDCE
jgi:hypothetical protein